MFNVSRAYANLPVEREIIASLILIVPLVSTVKRQRNHVSLTEAGARFVVRIRIVLPL